VCLREVGHVVLSFTIASKLNGKYSYDAHVNIENFIYQLKITNSTPTTVRRAWLNAINLDTLIIVVVPKVYPQGLAGYHFQICLGATGGISRPDPAALFTSSILYSKSLVSRL